MVLGNPARKAIHICRKFDYRSVAGAYRQVTGDLGKQVQKSGGWKTTLLGGEGLVVNLTGPGRVYMQTRSPQAFLDWLIPQLPSPQKND